MVDKTRYPHVAKWRTVSGGAYNPDTGEYESPAEGSEQSVHCRATPNSKGNYVQKADGKKLEYAFDLGFPLGYALPPERSIVEIYGVDGSKMYKGELIRCQVGVFSVRGWV